MHVLPVGNAGNISAYWLGYREYADAGIATKTPLMWGFQAQGFRPDRPGRTDPAPRDRRHRDPHRQPRVVAPRRRRSR